MTTGGDLIQLSDYRPHLSGAACCVACGHRWQAVAPAGTVELECPACRTLKGLFRNFCEPHDSTHRYLCQCGSYAFGITIVDDVPVVHCLVCGVPHHNLRVYEDDT